MEKPFRYRIPLRKNKAIFFDKEIKVHRFPIDKNNKNEFLYVLLWKKVDGVSFLRPNQQEKSHADLLAELFAVYIC